MELCLFLIATGKESEPVREFSVDGMRRLVVHSPVEQGGQDPFLAAERAPRSMLQCYFEELDALEAALAPHGALRDFADGGWRQQAMAVRRFPAAEHAGCSYVVGYDGPAKDFNGWLGHYLDHHTPLMARLPGVRGVEIYTRLDYRCELPIAAAAAMLRNKVVFNSPDALTAALSSPQRKEMREDFGRLPSFDGRVSHFPMLSRSLTC